MAKGKNIRKIQKMLRGETGKTIQVGYGDQDQKSGRKLGETWEDSDGVKWEQKEGYISKISSAPAKGIFHQQCKDCDKNCSLEKKHKDTWVRYDRCYYCQIDFEAMLKSRKIGEHGNKWQFWVKQQVLRRWYDMDKEAETMIFEIHEGNKTLFDKSVANALANDNLAKSRGN